jgi:putative transposase
MIKSVSYKRHRFPPKIIAHTVWLYFRFPLTLRPIEEMLGERGIFVSYETVRRGGAEVWAGVRSPPQAQETELS